MATMKTTKITFILALVLGMVSSASAAEVVFNDPNLKAAVEAELGVTDPTPSDMLLLTELDAENKGISDLTGLEYATNLTNLDLYRNQIIDISPLAGLTNLQGLQLHSNQIIDISPLAGLTNLTGLGLNFNQISDLSPLAGLTNLTNLSLGNDPISDISPLKGLTNLTWLYICQTQISDISPLAGLTKLNMLQLPENQISNISVLSGLTNLANLYLNGNQISDISPLVNLTNLLHLDLRANSLNPQACSVYIPQIYKNNHYRVSIAYDPCPPIRKPTVGNLEAGSITANSAEIFGEITDDGGEACQYQFRYKKAGGSYTFTEWTGSVRTGNWIWYSLTDLDQHSTYYFAARARNSAGEGDWPATDLSFTTLADVPVVMLEAATDITPWSVTFNARIVDDGGEACEYQFGYSEAYYGDTIMWFTPWTGSVSTGQSFSYAIGGPLYPLSRDSKYLFTARARNSAGASDWVSPKMSFITTPVVVKPTVTTLAANCITTSRAILKGEIIDYGWEACSYQFRYKKEGGDYVLTPYSTVHIYDQTFDFMLTGLEPNTTYYFAARAENSAGESDWPSTDMTFTTLETFEVKKPTVRTLPAVRIFNAYYGTNDYRIKGLINDDGGEACQYQFEYWFEDCYNSTAYHSWVKAWTGQVFECRIGVDPNITYSYRVRAKNSAGESEWGNVLSFTSPVIKPTVTPLPATSVTQGEARLNGKLTQDGGESCEYRFRYKRGADGTYEYTPWKGHIHTDNSLIEDLVGLTQETTYYFGVQVRNSVGESYWGKELTFKTTTIPEITDVRGTHFTSARPVDFLDGIDLPEEVKVAVNWNGLPPGKVIWVRTGSGGELPPLEDNCPDNQVTRTFNVGKDIGIGRALGVYAVSENGSRGAPKWSNFEVIPLPPMPSALQLKPYSRKLRPPFGDVELLTYSGVCSIPILRSSLGDWGYTIDKDIPMFGGQGVTVKTDADINLNVNGKNALFWGKGPSARTSFDIAGIVNSQSNVNTEFQGSWYYSGKPEELFWHSEAKLKIAIIMWHDLYNLDFTICGKGAYINAGLFFLWINEFSAENWHGEVNNFHGKIELDPVLYASGGFDVYVASLDVTADGGLDFVVNLSPPKPAKLEKACIVMSLKVKGSILCWDDTWKKSWEWCPPIMGSGSDLSVIPTSLSGVIQVIGSEEHTGLKLMGRDYLTRDYAVWLPPAPDKKHSRGGLSILSGSTGSQASAEGEQVLQKNIFEHSEPTIATQNGELLMAWVYDDPNRSSANRSEVVFSRSDEGTWIPPAPIWDDGTADFSPQIAVLPSGQVLCVWENANQFLSDDAELKDMASALDIAVASYDSTTKLWNAKTLTNDSHLDYYQQIATAANNTALVTWISNEKDDILGLDPNALNTIRYCFWNGSTWSQPGTAATGIGSILKTALTYNGTRAVYVYATDADWDTATDNDKELYALVYDGSKWSQPIRVTNDNVADVNPQVVFDGGGEVLLVWYRDGSIVSCRNLNIGTLRQVFQPEGAGARNFRLAKGPGEHISLVWTSSSIKSKGMDIFGATYDPLLGVWSNVYPLTSDIDEEIALTAAYVGFDELTLAYDKGRIRTDAAGARETYQTDLCVLRYKLVRDLAVFAEDLSVTPANPNPGDTVNIKAVIHNTGNFAEADVPVGFYYGDPADTGYGWLIGDVQVVKGPIVAGGTGEATVSWIIPDTNNLQEVYVVVDPPSHSDHDVAFIQVLVPDLMVDSVQWEKTRNNIRKITASIINQGVGSAHNVGATIRMDSPRGQELHNFNIPVINAGSYREVSWGWDISGIDFNDPEIVLCVVADGDQRVPESDEENNTGLCVLHVSKTADLTDDGSIDAEDLAVLSEHWLKFNQSDESDWQPDCDLNHDGHIDMKDLSILGKDWNWEAVWHTE